MFCGSKSFPAIEEDTHLKHNSSSKLSRWRTSVKTKKSTKKSTKKKNHLNPFSSRGLSQFGNLLAVLDGERRKILAEGDNSTVLFAYSNSIHKWIPIIVKKREFIHPWEKKTKTYHGGGYQYDVATTYRKLSNKPTSSMKSIKEEESRKIVKKKVVKKRSIILSSRYFFKVSVFITLILLCLALSGKTFAVCCTTVLFSMVPAMAEKQNSSASLQMKNRDLMKQRRQQYERKTVSDIHNRSHNLIR